MTEQEKLAMLAEQLIRSGDVEGAKILATASRGIASIETEIELAKFITQDKDTLEIKDQIRLLSRVEDPVIISGPSGVGKQHLAQALHGDRAGNFVHINCAGLPAELVESELFGYEKGAFTGANPNGNCGLLLHAKDGTIFLDEIGDFNLSCQAKLLVALQEKRIRKVGGREYYPINCRVVCATHHDLEKDIDSGKFRLDLYERLSVFEIKIKSLAERGETEIDLIATKLFNGRDTKGKFLPEEIKEDILRDFKACMLKGNVRKIQSLIRRYEVFKLRRIP